MSNGLIGIIGGTGLGDALVEHLSDAEYCDVETPFGKPSTKITVGKLGKRQIAFLNRHGEGHNKHGRCGFASRENQPRRFSNR
ncbi:MAG: hypothetical protein ACYS0I_09905 [Planctomycetota bacterium]|jgi:5'-methylthioadenosine phosphorylase